MERSESHQEVNRTRQGVKQWLSKQAFWQVHLPPPKCVDKHHYQVTIPNEMIADINKVGPLTYPKILQCDNGSEFKAEVTKLLEKHEIRMKLSFVRTMWHF